MGPEADKISRPTGVRDTSVHAPRWSICLRRFLFDNIARLSLSLHVTAGQAESPISGHLHECTQSVQEHALSSEPRQGLDYVKHSGGSLHVSGPDYANKLVLFGMPTAFCFSAEPDPHPHHL